MRRGILSACALLLFVAPNAGRAADEELRRVEALYDSGRFIEAADAAAEFPAPSAEISLLRGLALARAGRLAEAENVLRTGLARHPDDARFRVELAGAAYRAERYQDAKTHLRAALRLSPNDPYAAEFLASLHLRDGNLPAALKYWNRLDEPLIQNVSVLPPPPLNVEIRERALEIAGGQILTLSRLRAVEANLDDLDLFARRVWELKPRPDERFDLDLRLAPRGGWTSGGRARLVSLARGLPFQALHLDRLNIGERALNLRSLWRRDPDKRRVDIEFTGPIGNRPRRRFRAFLDARDENWVLAPSGTDDGAPFDLRSVSLGGDLVLRANDALVWTTGLDFSRRDFEGAASNAAFREGWAFQQRNRLDYRVWDAPERGLRLTAAAQLRNGRWLAGSASPFFLLDGDLHAAWRPAGKRDAWRGDLRWRMGASFGSAPFDRLFQLGMERDNDLWLRGIVGSRRGRKGSAPIGRDFALLGADLDRKVFARPGIDLRVGPFFDLGRVGSPIEKSVAPGWRPAAGVQLRLRALSGFAWSFVHGRDLRDGRAVFYARVER